MKKIITIMCMALIVMSCENNQVEEPKAIDVDAIGVKAEAPEFDTDYDKLMSEFAQVVGKAVRVNENFRGIVKDEALLLFDGDYDILVKTVAQKTVVPSDPSIRTRSNGGEITVKSLLDYYALGEERTRSGNPSIIEELQKAYPTLQISVPVHAEDWDPETYTPIVAFLPSNYDDATVTVIPGYDEDGDFVWVDAITEPGKPVIVIGINERINEYGNPIGIGDGRAVLYPISDILTIDDVPIESPAAPTSLTGNKTANSIFLSWSQTGTPEMYYVWRKGPAESSYKKIATVHGTNNRSYEDFSLVANKYYSYYITAVNRNAYTVIESPASNYVYIQAPTVPVALSKFEAGLSGKNVELRWNNDGDVNSNVKIEYKVPKYHSIYNLLTTRAGTYNNYIYSSSYKGTKIDYKATRTNSMGTSDSQYDFIYAPYRNSDATSYVYIKQIYFTDKKIERWPAGKPEFYLKVVGTNDAGKTIELQDQMNFEYNKKSNLSQVFNNRKAIDWKYFTDKDWYSSITFYLEEYDKPSVKFTFTASAKLNKKLFDTLDVSVGAELKVDFENKGEWCGQASIDYFDYPEVWIKFPNYGAQILISEKP